MKKLLLLSAILLTACSNSYADNSESDTGYVFKAEKGSDMIVVQLHHGTKTPFDLMDDFFEDFEITHDDVVTIASGNRGSYSDNLVIVLRHSDELEESLINTTHNE